MPRPKRIHVVGSSPRSGTTLAFELLTSCFDIDKFGKHEISLFEYPKEASANYASKKPTDLIHVKRLLAWDKKMHCLYMDRDPRDIVVSQHGSRIGEYWCDFPQWRRNERLIAHLRDHPRIHICRYEDLVMNPDHEQDLILARFPFLAKVHSFSNFEKVSQSSEAAQKALKGVRKISAKSVGTWRSDLPRVAAQLRAHPDMAEAVVAAGYAKDTSWTTACDGVDPDEAQSIRAQYAALRNKRGGALVWGRVQRRLRSFAQEARYALRNSLYR
ncbi:hypothetical protein [Roseobacter litoralis]|uniref:Sulfotransferase domain-containing protein n=1 Tax=Roseobacter litoralis (strain ATCC 49566 / DSM 6996 / JCM 21268 / NBRC 15278 / OCh 149) TaxID=391595 RepID=F7ZML6_ROSLO|nr:hypothetical protein [Roseobacter litoralis]AEI96553.1 hypothetical protein RLO149_p630450 [Roseobacter litoralis Och 149]